MALTSGMKFQISFKKTVLTLGEANTETSAGIQFIGFYRERDLSSFFTASAYASYLFNSDEEFDINGSGDLILNGDWVDFISTSATSTSAFNVKKLKIIFATGYEDISSVWVQVKAYGSVDYAYTTVYLE